MDGTRVDQRESRAEATLDDENYRMPGGGPRARRFAVLSIAPAIGVEKTTAGGLSAPKAILAAMVEGACVDFDTALRIESRYLAKARRGSSGEKPDFALFNRNGDQIRRVAAEGRAEMESDEGRHPRRRHDGRWHRLGQT